MASKFFMAAGALLFLGSVVSLFFIGITSLISICMITGFILLAGGMFAKSRRAVDETAQGLENDS